MWSCVDRYLSNSISDEFAASLFWDSLDHYLNEKEKKERKKKRSEY
jgi:hypothetical protein